MWGPSRRGTTLGDEEDKRTRFKREGNPLTRSCLRIQVKIVTGKLGLMSLSWVGNGVPLVSYKTFRITIRSSVWVVQTSLDTLTCDRSVTPLTLPPVLCTSLP